MNQLEEARALLSALTDEVDTLAAKDELTPEEDARFASLIETEVDEARARVTALEAREAKVAEIRAASSVESARIEGADPQTRGKTKKSDPFDLSSVRMGLSPSDRNRELQARAHDAIEQAPAYVTQSHRETAARHLDMDPSGKVAEHFLRYGSPEYTEAWTNYMLHGAFRSDEGESTRAAMTTTAQNGGYLIPFHLDPSIILTNNGSVNPFRAISRVDTISTNAWHGVSSAGVTAEWLAEAVEAADASPTVGQPTVPVHKGAAYVQASYEVTQDSNIAQQIAGLLADAKDNIEATAFATGSGSGQPTGIVTALQLVTASHVDANTNATFGLVDIFALVNGLPARHQDNASWLAHWATYNRVRQFGVGSVGDGAFWADLGPGIPPQLLGVSTHKTSAMASTLSAATASSDDVLVLGDFRKYLIVDRMGVETVYNPLVIGSSRRPTGEVGWACFWRVGANVLDANAFRMLRV